MRETHDHNRHAAGSFDRAVESATRLLSLKQERLTVGGTISVSNQSTEELKTLFSFLTNDLKINSVATAALRGDPKDQNKIPFNASGHRILNDLIEARTLSRNLSLFSRRFGRDLINARGIVARALVEKMLKENKYISPCTAGRTLAVMYADGSVYPCEMLPEEKMGSIQEFGMDFPALMRCEAAHKIRKQIRVGKCFCTFECAYHYNAIFELANWPALLRKYLDIKAGRRGKKTAAGT
jgi:radical SAM protein with 4Fe4S-binding SPASM domain